MEWIVWLFLESTGALAALLGVVLFVLLVHWRRGGRPRPLLIGLGLVVLLLAVQTLVVTRREHAARTMNRVTTDLLLSKTDALAAALAPSFSVADADGYTLDRDEFVALVADQLQATDIRWVECTGLELTRGEGEQFAVSVSYWAEVVTHDFSRALRSRWAITFRRTPEGWKITDIQPEHIDGLIDPSWRGIDRQ